MAASLSISDLLQIQIELVTSEAAADEVVPLLREYVPWAARGMGAGRSILERLLADARAEGFERVRLETLPFMTEAHALYRSLGFIESPPFEAESARSGIDALALFMELRLGD